MVPKRRRLPRRECDCNVCGYNVTFCPLGGAMCLSTQGSTEIAYQIKSASLVNLMIMVLFLKRL